jgi:hypothetical protein
VLIQVVQKVGILTHGIRNVTVLLLVVQNSLFLYRSFKKSLCLYRAFKKSLCLYRAFKKSLWLYRAFKNSLCICYYDCGYAIKWSQGKLAEYCNADPTIDNTDNLQFVRITQVSYCVQLFAVVYTILQYVACEVLNNLYFNRSIRICCFLGNQNFEVHF